MATLAPCAAKRTAIAWPMPDEPPVTSRFLPFRPGMPAVGPFCETGSCLTRGLIHPPCLPCNQDATAGHHPQEVLRLCKLPAPMRPVVMGLGTHHAASS